MGVRKGENRDSPLHSEQSATPLLRIQIGSHGHCTQRKWLETALPSWPLKKIAVDYWRLIRTPHIAWLFFLLILCQFSWSSYYEFIPPTLKNIFHFSPAMTGWFVGLIAFWLILATGVVIRLLLRVFNYRQLMWLSDRRGCLRHAAQLIRQRKLPQPLEPAMHCGLALCPQRWEM